MEPTLIFDARKLGDGGIGAYIENLIEGFRRLRMRDEFRGSIQVFVPAISKITPEAADTVSRWSRDWECIEEPSSKYSVAEYLALPLRHAGRIRRAAVYHSPHLTLPYGIAIPRIVTIHDALLISHAEQPWKRHCARYLLRSAMRRAELVLTVSAQSKHELERLVGRVSRQEIQVVHNAVEIGTKGATAAPAPARRLLWVGNRKPHKGLDLFLDALEWNRNRGKGLRDLRLTIVCDRLSEEQRRRASLLHAEVLTKIPREQLESLYQEAALLVLSSFEEGCGLPAVEALARGVTVVSTPLASIREMCAAGVFYAAGWSAEALASAITDAVEAETFLLRSRLHAGRSALSRFDVETQARKTAMVYDLAIATHGGFSFFLAPSSPQPLRLLSGGGGVV